MLILRLWNYILGYVIINVEGYFMEKFINICTHRQIRLWNVRWSKNRSVFMRISISDFRKLKPIVFKTKCRVHIINKKGLPFILNRYKGRKAFIVGFGICIAAFFLISSFVWDVSVSGNYKVSTQVIMEKLSENGVKVGALKYCINPEDIAGNMMLELSDLARISISLRGTRVKVVVNERVKPPDLIKKNIPCDLVAEKEGVIFSIVAKDGLEMVKVGDTVTKGQLLVTGKIENTKNPEAKPLMVHSLGSIKARTWYEVSVPVEQKLVKVKRTGLKKDKYSITLFTKKIKLFHGKIPYNNSEHMEIKKKLCIGENFILPFELIIDEYYEYNLEHYDIDLEAAQKIAIEKALVKVKEKIPQNIEVARQNVIFEQQENGLNIAKVVVECIEEIGVTREIREEESNT